MGSAHTPADDIVYDLVSIQYHAMQGAYVYDKYLQDAAEHEDVADFIRQCRDEDARRATRCHELLRELTREGGLKGASR